MADQSKEGLSRQVCHECIDDEFLATKVREQGELGECAYCCNDRSVISLDVLGDRIHDVLHEHFRLTPGYPEEPYELLLYREGDWERRGDPVEQDIS